MEALLQIELIAGLSLISLERTNTLVSIMGLEIVKVRDKR